MLRAERVPGDHLVLCPHEAGYEAGAERGEGYRWRQEPSGTGTYLAAPSWAPGCLRTAWKHASCSERLEEAHGSCISSALHLGNRVLLAAHGNVDVALEAPLGVAGQHQLY